MKPGADPRSELRYKCGGAIFSVPFHADRWREMFHIGTFNPEVLHMSRNTDCSLPLLIYVIQNF